MGLCPLNWYCRSVSISGLQPVQLSLLVIMCSEDR